jgi:hypothetical protein
VELNPPSGNNKNNNKNKNIYKSNTQGFVKKHDKCVSGSKSTFVKH